MLKWERKVWGWTRTVHEGNNASEHELLLEAGGFCSFHYHKHRSNDFVLYEGRVRVVWAFGCYYYYCDLEANDKISVPAMVPHQFQVQEDGMMVELYKAKKNKYDLKDIFRLCSGGKVTNSVTFLDDDPKIHRLPGHTVSAHLGSEKVEPEGKYDTK